MVVTTAGTIFYLSDHFLDEILPGEEDDKPIAPHINFFCIRELKAYDKHQSDISGRRLTHRLSLSKLRRSSLKVSLFFSKMPRTSYCTWFSKINKRRRNRSKESLRAISIPFKSWVHDKMLAQYIYDWLLKLLFSKYQMGKYQRGS